MENLLLNDSSNSKSFLSYTSAMTTLSDSQNPLSPSIITTPANTDPLLSPLSPPPNTSPNPNSYVHVIFNPLESDNELEINGVESPTRAQKSNNSPLSYLKITVSNPQKEVEASNSIVPGFNNYVTYLITTVTNLPEYGGPEFKVRRRFKDVVSLSDRLSESYRGFFIPPRPDKNVVESQVMQKQDFVEQRRVALERYLRRLGDHPLIRKSDELRMFLQAQGRDISSLPMNNVRLPQKLFGDSGSVAGKGGRDLLRVFKELRQSMSNDWGGSGRVVEEDDNEFLENKERLRDLEQQLNFVSQQAEALVKAQRDMGETMGELGLAYIKLTKFENEEAVISTQRLRAADMKNVATAAVKSSRFYRGLNAQTIKHLDTLHEYMGLMTAVHAAFSDRSSALLTVQRRTSELSSLNSRVEKLEATSSKTFGADKSRINKIDELKEVAKVTEDAKNCAVREYERIKENNRSEIERLDRERKADFLNMLKGFVINQVAYTEKIGNEWAKVAEDTSGYVKESA